MTKTLKYDYNQFFELALDMLCIADMNGYFLEVNPAFISGLGYSKEELKSRPFIEFVHPNDVQSTLEEVKKLAQGVETIYFENRYLAKNGTYRWLAWTSHPIMSKGVLYAVARDVTEKKELTDKLNTFNLELEREVHVRTMELERSNSVLLSKIQDNQFLFKELNHRVKNNMQMINSMMQLYSGKIKDEQLRGKVIDFGGRVSAISLAYNQLSESIGQKPFDIEVYVRVLFNELNSIYGLNKNISLQIDILKSNLNDNTIIPLSLILYEIISNAFKHAFNKHSKGQIFISLNLDKKSKLIELSVGDDGEGIDRGFFQNSEDSFGIDLIRTLVGQLDGSVTLVDMPGTVYQINFMDQQKGNVSSFKLGRPKVKPIL